MKNIVIYSMLLFFMFGACVTVVKKWDEARIDAVSEQCKEEYLTKQPPTARWHNLKTQERNKKKKEFEEFKKKQMVLYRALYIFKKTYLSEVNADGKCKKNECSKLEKISQTFIEACPAASASFPAVYPE